MTDIDRDNIGQSQDFKKVEDLTEFVSMHFLNFLFEKS